MLILVVNREEEPNISGRSDFPIRLVIARLENINTPGFSHVSKPLQGAGQHSALYAALTSHAALRALMFT